MTTIDEVVNSLKNYDEERTAALEAIQGQLDEATAKNVTQADQITQLTQQVADLKQQILDMQKPPVPNPPVKQATVIGFSTKEAWWDSEMLKLTPLTSRIHGRRIYCDLGKGANHQEATIRQALTSGQIPQLSYKVPDVVAAINGSMDSVAKACGAFLASLNVEVDFAVWHEPNNDMTPAQFEALNLRLAPLMKSAKVKYGQYINGFLTVSDPATFNAFLTDKVLAISDWTGIDAYHAGSMANPDPVNTPGKRIRAWLDIMKQRNVKLPLQIGEYNGFTADAILDAGKAILDNPQIAKACMWSSQVGSGTDFRLSGDRLTAFKATLADDRVMH